jgi:YebC/PmpR family DNA-binding regulatory protein
VAAKNGGPDPVTNLRLRYAIDKARAVSCPKDNIERSIKKATGEAGGQNFEEVIYEGYGPGGVAVLCTILTDNRNRTAGDLRRAFDICGGNLGATGCVSYLFNYKGIFVIDATQITEEKLLEVILESGADDLTREGDYFEVTCDPKSFDDVKKAIEDHGVTIEDASVGYIPTSTVELDVENGRKMKKLLDLLDENEDVQDAYSNDKIPDEALE